jgi:hypothetical protein
MRTLPNTIYTINGNTILSFRDENTCHKFAMALESHYRVTRTFPNIDEEFWCSSNTTNLEDISVDRWEIENLKEFCIHNFFDFLDVKSMINYKISGQITKFEGHSLDMCKDYLERKLV